MASNAPPSYGLLLGNAVCDGRPQQRGGRDAILPTRTATAHATCSSPVDDNSPFLRLYSANEFWVPNPGAQTVRCRLQAMPTGCPGRCEGVPIPAHRSVLPTLRRAAKVLTLRGVPGPAKQPCIKTSTQAGELSVPRQHHAKRCRFLIRPRQGGNRSPTIVA